MVIAARSPAISPGSSVTGRWKRPAEKARTPKAIAPRIVHGLGDPDPWPDGDRRTTAARVKLEWRLVESKPVLGASDAERLAQAARAGAQQPLILDVTPALHGSDAGRGLQRPDQHRARAAFALADEVEAPMDAVGAVDIGATGRAEHDGVALGLPAKTVCRGIGLMIGLDLDDDAARALEQQRGADEIGGD